MIYFLPIRCAVKHIDSSRKRERERTQGRIAQFTGLKPAGESGSKPVLPVVTSW